VIARLGENLGMRLLNVASRHVAGYPDVAPAYVGKSKIQTLLGPTVWSEIAGRRVIDFGCGIGHEAVELAQRGAAHVIGVDTKARWRKMAEAHAQQNGVADRCTFVETCPEKAEVIVCLDAFEHFDDPAGILETMSRLLEPGGRILVSFGPTWYHPLGGHIYSVFPFAHLLFPERALVRWRGQFKTDGARTIKESGLNQMTIRRFVGLVAASPLAFESLETVPIRRLRWLACRPTREFTTAVVRCRLVHRRVPALQYA
jgi:SAM-dependent methyltransferase